MALLLQGQHWKMLPLRKWPGRGIMLIAYPMSPHATIRWQLDMISLQHSVRSCYRVLQRHRPHYLGLAITEAELSYITLHNTVLPYIILRYIVCNSWGVRLRYKLLITSRYRWRWAVTLLHFTFLPLSSQIALYWSNVLFSSFSPVNFPPLVPPFSSPSLALFSKLSSLDL